MKKKHLINLVYIIHLYSLLTDIWVYQRLLYQTNLTYSYYDLNYYFSIYYIIIATFNVIWIISLVFNFHD